MIDVQGRRRWRPGEDGLVSGQNRRVDGARSVAEMAHVCDETYGYRYVTITDHSQGLRIAGGSDARSKAQELL